MVLSKPLDVCLAAMVAAAAMPMRVVRHFSLDQIPTTAAVLRRTGIFPLRNHYYEPLFDFRHIDLSQPRELRSVDLNVARQHEVLASFQDMDGLSTCFDPASPNSVGFNPNFWSVDAELWFHMIRASKPRTIIEIGSGHSTKVAARAIARIRHIDPAYSCDHICIEPFEMPWLETLGVQVIRDKVETLDLSLFGRLDRDDILFIDSSHMIRPQGDVLFEFLEILPSLAPGVVVHIHDIFTPRDYPERWIKQPRFWNEQYLFEAFMSNNAAWEILLAANFLKHSAFEMLQEKCPMLSLKTEPGSMYIRKL